MKKINFVLSLVIASFFSLLSLVSADVEDRCGMWGGMMTGLYGGTGMFFGWLFGALVIVALILLIVWLIKQIKLS